MTQARFDASDYQGTGPENYERCFVPAIGAPLAIELVEAQRRSLHGGLIPRWWEYAVDSGMEIRLDMSTVVGR